MNPECKICHGSTEKFSHPKIGDFFHCTRCEFISKDERQILPQNEELQLYERHENSIDDPDYVAFFQRFLEDAVFPYENGGSKGFDFGSGPSPVLAQLLERYHDYDMDIYDIYYAPEKVYTGKKYDLITCTEVAEHLENPVRYFRLFAALLKPGGILSVMTLFHNNDEEDFTGWYYMRDLTHISFYTPETLRYIAEETGLEMIHTDGVRYATFRLE